MKLNTKTILSTIVLGSMLALAGCASTLTPTIEAGESSKLETQVVGHHTITLKVPKTLSTAQESYVTDKFVQAGNADTPDECALVLQNTFVYPTLPVGVYMVQKKHNSDSTSVTLAADITAAKTSVECYVVTAQDVALFNAKVQAMANAVSEHSRCTSYYGNKIC